jgi:hypothetical protein
MGEVLYGQTQPHRKVVSDSSTDCQMHMRKSWLVPRNMI